MRSTISSRSNSASAAKIPKTSLPGAVVVSIAAPWPVRILEPDAALGELVDQVDEVAQVAAEPVELPRDQDVAPPQRLEAGGEPGPVVALAGGQVLVEVAGLDAGGEQGVPLQVQDLRAVGLRDAHVAEQHVTQTSRWRDNPPPGLGSIGAVVT